MYRFKSIKFFLNERPDDFELCRNVESHCHSISSTLREYQDNVLRCAFNLRQNPALKASVVYLDDVALAKGTIIEQIETERQVRAERFERMLQEKYEALDDQKFQAIVRCRRCGSEEVSWDEKQTRSADEGASVFCVCTNCKNRWVMR